MASLIVVARILIASHGLPSRYDERVASLAAVLDHDYRKPYRLHQCFLGPADKIRDFDRQVCLSESSSEPNVLLTGDSHAADLWHGLQKVFARTNVMQAAVSGCRPFFFKQENVGETLEGCNLLMTSSTITHHRPDLIILAGVWDLGEEEGIAMTLDWLRQRQLPALLAGPDPNWNLPLPMLATLAEKRGDPGLVERHLVASREALDTRFAVLAVAHGGKYVSIYLDIQCALRHTLPHARRERSSAHVRLRPLDGRRLRACCQTVQ